MMQTRFRQQNRQLRGGATAVEFALVAPVFFLLLFASFEFSRLHVIRHSADNAAYEAARTAIVPGATAGEAVEVANDLMNIMNARGVAVTVNPPVLGPDVKEVTVTVDVPLGQNGWITPRFTGDLTLRSQSTLRTERTGEP